MAVGIRLFTERTGDGSGKPIIDSDNGEELIYDQDSVAIVLGNRAPEGPGTLYFTSKQVVWLSDVDRSSGYAVDIVSVSLHAVSRDPEAYPSPCIYTQIETGDDEDEEEEEEEEEDEADSQTASRISNIKEMRLVPSDPSHLETLFEVFCECAELNPEPMEGEIEENSWIYTVDQLNGEDLEEENFDWSSSSNQSNSIGHSNGDHDLTNNVLQLQINDQRFEDAEETEHERNSDHQ